MPLVSASMQSIFLRSFPYPNQPPNVEEAAKRYAEAYFSYAKGAIAKGAVVQAPPVLTPANKEQLRRELLAAMKNPNSGTHIKMAKAWATGVSKFWLSPPVNFVAGPIVSITGTLVFPGQPILLATLLSLFVNNRNSISKAAGDLAKALDAATKTIIVNLQYPNPAAPPPILIDVAAKLI